MLSALLFDFGGTLDGPAHWLDRFLAQYRRAGIDISRDELDPAFEHATRTGYRAAKAIQRFGLMELVRFLVGNQLEFLARVAPPEIRARFESLDSKGKHRVTDKIASDFAAETREGLKRSKSVLAQLKPRFQIGVVSNFYGNLDRIIQEAGMKQFVSTVVDSSRVGIFKPQPAIFDAALRTLRISPEAAAMVGDSVTKDCSPAHSLGIRTIWYRPGPSAEKLEGKLPDEVVDLTIASLEELTTLAL